MALLLSANNGSGRNGGIAQERRRPDEPLTKHALLLINPVAGRLSVQRPFPQVIRCLMDKGYWVSTLVSSKPGDLRRYAAQYGAQQDLIVCAGGDGTLHEVVSGLAEQNLHVPLGYLPCGSTNDFALSRGISTDLLLTSAAIASGHSSRQDIGRFNGQFFTYIASFGAFTWMGYTTDQAEKNRIGYAAYLRDGARSMGRLGPVPMKICADGQTCEGDYLFGTICNATVLGGILHLPEETVDLNDGKLELLLIRAPQSLADLEQLIRNLLAGRFSNPHVLLLQGERFTIENRTQVEWSLDGESSGAFAEAEVAAVPGFLELRN